MNALTESIPKTYTIEEYLFMKEMSLQKHHFKNGEIMAIPIRTYNHSLIATNFTTALNNAIENKGSNIYLQSISSTNNLNRFTKA